MPAITSAMKKSNPLWLISVDDSACESSSYSARRLLAISTRVAAISTSSSSFRRDTILVLGSRALSQFERSLTNLFGRRVDLIMPSALRNPWFRREAEKARSTL